MQKRGPSCRNSFNLFITYVGKRITLQSFFDHSLQQGVARDDGVGSRSFVCINHGMKHLSDPKVFGDDSMKVRCKLGNFFSKFVSGLG